MGNPFVLLEYCRVENTSTGRILVHDGSEDREVYHFTCEEMPEILRHFAVALQENPTARAGIQRTDRPGLLLYTLDDGIVELFRTDPVAAIASMCPPSPSPSLAIQRSKQERTVTAALRSGFDTLADAFGDLVFTRYNGARNRAECPGCGLWVVVVSGEDAPLELSCHNPKCWASKGRSVPVAQVLEKWVALQTTDVLATHCPRFYFPRAWNEGALWISWEQLNERYQEYQKEKAKL